jgi:pimeloyl-ACP methyl ester carboxylesterase
VDIALVHGSYHGGWCWDLLRPELERIGHRVITMDLPVSQPGLGADDYAQAIEDVLDPTSEPILVAHSAGGLVTPMVAARRPIRRLIFIAAFLPVPGQSAADQRAAEPIGGTYAATTAEWEDRGENVWMVGPNTARELFFNDVPDEVTSWAIERLQPQCYDVMNEVTPLTAWPDVQSSVIVCGGDHAINPEWVRSAARDRLGTEAVEIRGGHSPFMSRPRELARIIHSLISDGN